jgi:prepilin-type N-terminal cleavage/methylation domain-containing protein
LKRRGFTLIEVLAALVIVTAIMLLSMTVGRRWVQEQRELAFFRRVETEWNSAVVDAVSKHVGYRFQFTSATSTPPNSITIARDGVEIYNLDVPQTLDVGGDLQINVGFDEAFTKPMTKKVQSALGGSYVLAFELGWGRLFITKNGVPVD